ncbi:MAG TPA: hypothetical protein VNX68_06395, partial [Nitrosopumilaceae archaeon]|nr:hypothetical protein [Nitrosopumilaceae archaeon]
MNKGTINNINESLLKQRFSEYEVAYEESFWDDFEKNLDEIKVQKSISLSKRSKVVLGFATLCVAGVVVFVNLDKNSLENSPS